MNPYNDKETKRDQVERMFDTIAPSYDRLNHVMSLDIDKVWRRRLVRLVAATHPQHVLDIAAGTGDLSIMMAHRIPGVRVTGVDISERMLEIARHKASKARLDVRTEFVTGDAENLPSAGDEFDGVTVAFGVRNFQNLDASLREMHRVLRKGGSVFVLEFGEPHSRLFGSLYRCYSRMVLPRLGGMVSGDGKAYGYLMDSIREFAKVDVAEHMRKAGFMECTAMCLTNGVAMIYRGVK